jgi:hypothetical protein
MNHRQFAANHSHAFLVFIFLCMCLPNYGAAQQAHTGSSAISKDIPSAERPDTFFVDYKEDPALSLAGGNLPARPPILGERDEFPAFSRELVQVQWRPGDPIDLYVIKPRNLSKPPVILYLYSYPSETDRFRDDAYCERITRSGFAAIGFVSAMTGHRYHDRPMREWFVSELPEALSHSVHDVEMILNYAATRGDLDLDHVGVFGQGSGATIAILSKSVDSRIKFMNLIDPWGDWPLWIAKSSLIPQQERPNYLSPEFQARVAPLDPVGVLPRLDGNSIRLEIIKDDHVTPAAVSEKIKQSVPAMARVTEYDTSRDHYTASADGKTFDWLKQQLKPTYRNPPQPVELGKQTEQFSQTQPPR